MNMAFNIQNNSTMGYMKSLHHLANVADSANIDELKARVDKLATRPRMHSAVSSDMGDSDKVMRDLKDYIENLKKEMAILESHVTSFDKFSEALEKFENEVSKYEDDINIFAYILKQQGIESPKEEQLILPESESETLYREFCNSLNLDKVVEESKEMKAEIHHENSTDKNQSLNYTEPFGATSSLLVEPHEPCLEQPHILEEIPFKRLDYISDSRSRYIRETPKHYRDTPVMATPTQFKHEGLIMTPLTHLFGKPNKAEYVDGYLYEHDRNHKSVCKYPVDSAQRYGRNDLTTQKENYRTPQGQKLRMGNNFSNFKADTTYICKSAVLNTNVISSQFKSKKDMSTPEEPELTVVTLPGNQLMRTPESPELTLT